MRLAWRVTRAVMDMSARRRRLPCARPSAPSCPTHSEDPFDLLLYHPMASWRLARPTRGAGAVICPRGSISTNYRPGLVECLGLKAGVSVGPHS